MIVGKKVRLRPIEREDLPRFVEWFSDPEVRRHLLVYLPFSLVQEERWFESLLGRLERQEEVLLAIETADGVHIGNVGLHAIDWKNRNAELGIAIGEKACWGQGYGADAIRTLLASSCGWTRTTFGASTAMKKTDSGEKGPCARWCSGRARTTISTSWVS